MLLADVRLTLSRPNKSNKWFDWQGLDYIEHPKRERSHFYRNQKRSSTNSERVYYCVWSSQEKLQPGKIKVRERTSIYLREGSQTECLI